MRPSATTTLILALTIKRIIDMLLFKSLEKTKMLSTSMKVHK